MQKKKDVIFEKNTKKFGNLEGEECHFLWYVRPSVRPSGSSKNFAHFRQPIPERGGSRGP